MPYTSSRKLPFKLRERRSPLYPKLQPIIGRNWGQTENDAALCSYIDCRSNMYVPLTKQMQRNNIGIDVLQHYSISPKQRSELHPGLFKLFDVCHENDRKHVFVLLGSTGKLIFKELFEKYNKNFKFTGKT